MRSRVRQSEVSLELQDTPQSLPNVQTNTRFKCHAWEILKRFRLRWDRLYLVILVWGGIVSYGQIFKSYVSLYCHQPQDVDDSCRNHKFTETKSHVQCKSLEKRVSYWCSCFVGHLGFKHHGAVAVEASARCRAREVVVPFRSQRWRPHQSAKLARRVALPTICSRENNIKTLGELHNGCPICWVLTQHWAFLKRGLTHWPRLLFIVSRP